MAKFDLFLSLDCARDEGVGAQSKERKGSNFAVYRRGAIVHKPEGHIRSKNLAIAIWQPCFKDSSYTLREEYVVYDSDSFMADIGGFFGLLLGQSMLGIYYMSVEWVTSSHIWKLGQ